MNECSGITSWCVPCDSSSRSFSSDMSRSPTFAQIGRPSTSIYVTHGKREYQIPVVVGNRHLHLVGLLCGQLATVNPRSHSYAVQRVDRGEFCPKENTIPEFCRVVPSIISEMPPFYRKSRCLHPIHTFVARMSGMSGLQKGRSK